MSKVLTSGLLFLSLLGSASVTHAAMSCEDVFKGPGINNRAGSYASRSIEARISSINSVGTLAKFLEDIGGIGSANHDHVVSMAEVFYRELGQQGVDRIARNLLMSHSHRTQEAVMSALVAHVRGEAPKSKELERYLPKAIDQEAFLRWTRLGERMTEDSNFMNQLELALRDSKGVESAHAKPIDLEKAFVSVVEGLKGLNNASLVGQFIEFFNQADRITRQYIFSEVTELKSVDGQGVTIVVKGTSSEQRNAYAKVLEAILKKPINQLQEEAYFVYKSNGISSIEKLADAETIKNVALRFMKRMRYDLLEYDVEHASGILAQHPSADPKIDAAMVKLLESGATMPKWQHKFSDIRYALHELLILERNARGLSALNIDLSYSTQLLSSKIEYRLYLVELLKIHAKFDLRNFPALQKIAITYFHKHPESLSELDESQNTNVQKFKRDFGI